MRQYHNLLAAGVNCCAAANLGQEIASYVWPNEPIDYMQRKILRTLRDEGPLTLADLARKHRDPEEMVESLKREVLHVRRGTDNLTLIALALTSESE